MERLEAVRKDRSLKTLLCALCAGLSVNVLMVTVVSDARGTSMNACQTLVSMAVPASTSSTPSSVSAQRGTQVSQRCQ